MGQAPRLQQKQVQRLAMTQDLKLSLKLLQLDHVDLAAYVTREIEQNPLLELEKDGDKSAVPEVGSANGPDPEEGGDESLDYIRRAFDSDLTKTVYNNDSETDFSVPVPGPDEENVCSGKTLNQHIHDQLGLLSLSPEESLIANYLADNLNEAGYVACTLAEAGDQLGCTERDVEKVLLKLQGLEPAGVFARDLKECLAIQLKDRGFYESCAGDLLDNLDLVAEGDLKSLRKICRVSEPRLQNLIGHIKALDPKPALHLSGGEPVQTVIPDVFVSREKGKNWRIELNTETLPKILVNERYFHDLSNRKLTPKDSSYLKDCKSRAGWLKRALNQRAETLLRVSGNLVQAQKDFFEKGIRHLRPMTMRSLADSLELHESTISRVVQNKYLSSPRGVFKLKYFFTSGVGKTNGGKGESSESIKARIHALIQGEPKDKPLSDGKIAASLKDNGADVSRRTVVKYREQMNIPSSFERRRQNKKN